MSQIVVKKKYFDNIKTAIDAMNNFFASNFQTKAFPVVNNNFQLDRIIARTISWLNNVEPAWIEDTKNAKSAVDKLREFLSEGKPEQPGAVNPKWEALMSGQDQVATDNLHAYIGFKVLQYITDNFESYEKLLNGIYSFKLFTKPSQYRTEIEKFTAPIQLTEIDQDGPIPGEYKLFDSEDYINSIFENDQIKLPENMVADTEVQRFKQFMDLEDAEIVIDDTVQEAAEVNYFTNAKPEHIRYVPSNKKFQISRQFEAAIKKMLKAFDKCETSDDLAEVFKTWIDADLPSPDLFSHNVIPCILARVFNSTRKFPFDMYDVDQMGLFTKSYKSIVSKNNGAKRFANMDIFSTFKTDKAGTMKFIEDFLYLRLVNDENAVIQNSTLRTIFNIFDSRIYLDILYNLIPDDVKEKEGMSEDAFVKDVRKRINANSKNANPYQTEKKLSESIETSDQVKEYVANVLRAYDDVSIADTQYCEQFSDAVHAEIDTLGDALYNKKVSQLMIDRYVGESYALFAEEDDSAAEGNPAEATGGGDGSDDSTDPGIDDSSDADMSESGSGDESTDGTSSDTESTDSPVQEANVVPAETGDIPDYMKNRIDLQDKADEAENKPPVTVTDVQLPPDVPTNPADDLADSIDARLDADGTSLGDMLGSGYQGAVKPSNQGGPGTVVYNITNNNYSNSHNTTTTTTTTNDLSSNKQTSTVTNTSNDLSSNKQTNTRTRANKPSNNYDNTSNPSNTKDSSITFSTGKSVQEVFALLQSEEPLFVEADAGNPPPADILTTAKDLDMKSLPLQQKLKKGAGKIVGTGKAIVKPISRTKQWMHKMIDSLIKRDENKVKDDILNNKSYRSAIYKVARIALKVGMFSVLATIHPWFGVAYGVKQGLDYADRQRLKKEVEAEVGVEIQIIDNKIKNLEYSHDPKQRQELYKLMRMRQKLVSMIGDAAKQTVVSQKSVY